MKNFLFLLLASFLVLAACGNKEENKSEDTKETKSSSKDDKKKSNDDKNASKEKKTDKEDNSDSDNQTTSSDSQSQNSDGQQANSDQQDQQNKQMNANQQQNTANTQQPQQDNQQTNGYDPNNPYMNMPDQEWRKNTGDGLSSGEKQTMYAIENNQYEVEDAEQKLASLKYYQNKYSQ
ncbi:hypothetical protein [Staphylococcus sp. GDY8P218P]|uniref:hypothetical protein n=1 Tax=Staphylococcus sp. GDY8P218P TaxID=2804178 RepID=UPI001AEC5A26|nr:hypothetical protein [Staphylococcus sp. GDY8P218P]